uniref:Envelope glycoprotein gL n=1 Tax=Otarine gammaherpesvirus 4 TaxID=2801541 RepID=A0A889IYA6_9GAMA|nr:Envelope glycoprotein gL [Otarine gammaherpesvirus 4]
MPIHQLTIMEHIWQHIFTIFVYIWVAGTGTLADRQTPCCSINPNVYPGDVSSILQIQFVGLNTCGGSNVAKVILHNANQTTVDVVCANGFNVMAFLMTIIQQLDKSATREELALLKHLETSLKGFSDHLTPATATTSRFPTVWRK